MQDRLTETSEINRILAADLDASRRLIAELSHERDKLQREADAQRLRAQRTAKHNRVLAARLRSALRERDDIALQLWESSTTINEVASSLELVLR